MMQAKHNNLIIVPVGAPIDKFIKMHNMDFDVNNHWRNTNNERNYDILAIQYGDFAPEDGTYDQLVKIKGSKWKLLKQLPDIDFNQWSYIGFFDDDVVVHAADVCASFDFANSKSIGAFQMSVDSNSESSYPILRQNPDLIWSETNFIEIMCPCFTSKNFYKLLDFLSAYDVDWGWGLDYIFSDLFDCNLGVLHFISMFHPSRLDSGTNVNTSSAHVEWDEVMKKHYPKYKGQAWEASRGRELNVYFK
ncbi:hypothetical protein UFOVP245_196 [uncultured Caudovirales phage]|uniref:Uncharacterized protein n=1 Tax=uncultured Caudovirales phage TaxID=2100421 RepID=A0A6J7WUE5_9CAUD|nr:hypothetical protein UFOVP245_196 [uncultured Caudovirales phage]